MARYIDADELLKNLPDDLPYKASVKRVLIQAPTEDVVPKSEVDLYKRLNDELEDELSFTYDKLEVANGEVERLERILDSYLFLYGTVTDKQAIIDHEIAKAAMELIKVIDIRIDLTNSQTKGISSLYWKGIYDGRKDAYKDIKEIIEQRYAEGI